MVLRKEFNKIEKYLARIIKKNGKRAQINKIRSGRGEVTTDTEEIERIIRHYYEQLSIKWKTLKKGQISRNVQCPKTELGRNRKYEQTDYH